LKQKWRSRFLFLIAEAEDMVLQRGDLWMLSNPIILNLKSIHNLITMEFQAESQFTLSKKMDKRKKFGQVPDRKLKMISTIFLKPLVLTYIDRQIKSKKEIEKKWRSPLQFSVSSWKIFWFLLFSKILTLSNETQHFQFWYWE